LRLVVAHFLASIALLPVLWANSGAEPKSSAAILDGYLNRARQQESSLRDVTMEVEIEANLPRLNKRGKLHALRHISRLGKVTYEALSFIGDNIIKKDVIARYLAAEIKSTEDADLSSIAINRENYKFKYRGMYGSGDWKLHLFELSPRKKRVGLFDGWLWLEASTCLPVRESGRFVKNPSIFLRRIEFLRDYEIRDGVAVPVRIESTIQTRLVGTAKLDIRFGNITPNSERARAATREMAASP